MCACAHVLCVCVLVYVFVSAFLLQSICVFVTACFVNLLVLVKFVKCTLVFRDCIPFYKYTKRHVYPDYGERKGEKETEKESEKVGPRVKGERERIKRKIKE